MKTKNLQGEVSLEEMMQMEEHLEQESQLDDPEFEELEASDEFAELDFSNAGRTVYLPDVPIEESEVVEDGDDDIVLDDYET